MRERAETACGAQEVTAIASELGGKGTVDPVFRPAVVEGVLRVDAEPVDPREQRVPLICQVFVEIAAQAHVRDLLPDALRS